MSQYIIECSLNKTLSFDDICERMKYIDTNFLLEAKYHYINQFVKTSQTTLSLQISHKYDEHYSNNINIEVTDSDGKISLNYIGNKFEGDVCNILSEFVKKAGGKLIEYDNDDIHISNYKGEGFDIIEIAHERTENFKEKINKVISEYTYSENNLPNVEELIDSFYQSQLDILQIQNNPKDLNKKSDSLSL